MIGICSDAGDNLGIAGLHGARCAAQRHDAARAAKRNMIEPARRQAEMLGQPDRRVRPNGEARHRETVDVRRAESGARHELAQRTAKPPMRAVGRIAPVGNRHRQTGDDAVVGLSDRARCHAAGLVQILAHMNSWMLPNAASQLTMSTRLSLIFSLPSMTVSVWVAQAAYSCWSSLRVST